jgi:hypothetical protein
VGFVFAAVGRRARAVVLFGVFGMGGSGKDYLSLLSGPTCARATRRACDLAGAITGPTLHSFGADPADPNHNVCPTDGDVRAEAVRSP